MDFKFYATLFNSCNCPLETVCGNTIEEVRLEIVKSFIPVMEPGDKIEITEE